MFERGRSKQTPNVHAHKHNTGDGANPPGNLSARSLRVLIVDANAETADSLSRLVALAGHEVRWTSDSASALKIALVQIPQVVLLAIDVLEMDGYQLARQLRLDSRLKACFLIAMRSKTDDGGRQHCDEADIDLFLAQPVDQPLLESLLSWEGERLDDFDSQSRFVFQSGPDKNMN
jgi:CheY-like chemotaxis protein